MECASGLIDKINISSLLNMLAWSTMHRRALDAYPAIVLLIYLANLQKQVNILGAHDTAILET